VTAPPPDVVGPRRRGTVARRSIRARILGAFVLSLAAWVGALGYTLVQLQQVGQGIAVLDAGYLPLADTAARLGAAVRQLDQEQERQSRESPRPLAGAKTSAALVHAALADATDHGLAVAEAARLQARDPADAAAFSAAVDALHTVQAQAEAYEDAVAAWVAAAQGGEGQEGRALSDLARIRTQLLGSTGDLAALVEGRIQRVSERTAAAQRRAVAVGGAAGLLAIALAGLMAGAALVTLRPIAQLTEQVQRLAAGQEAGRLEITSVDEVGLLAREFNAMADAVSERDRRLSDRAAALDRLSFRLRRIVDTIHAGLVVAEDGRVTTVNPAAQAVWGLEEGDPLPPALADLDPGRHEQISLPQQPEGLFDIDVVPFGDSGRLVVGEDVTRRVQDRERLARSERLALVGQMLAQITHEVRNPLNAMSLHAELLDEELATVEHGADSGSEARAMLQTISEELARLERVTARYLDLSRRREPELTPTNPTALVEGVLRTDEELWRRAGAELRLEGAVPGVVELAADTLRRALHNIVRNAVEAGAHHIVVRLSRHGERLRVAVDDDGPGIGSDDLRRVFDPFFTTKVKGTGLGLAISRQELEEAGGSLAASSGQAGGSCFVLELPGRWDVV